MTLLRCPKFLRCLTADAGNFDRGHSLTSLPLPPAALSSLPTSARPDLHRTHGRARGPCPTKCVVVGRDLCVPPTTVLLVTPPPPGLAPRHFPNTRLHAAYGRPPRPPVARFVSHLATGTAPAFLMRSAAAVEVAKSKKACAAGERVAPLLVTSTKGR